MEFWWCEKQCVQSDAAVHHLTGDYLFLAVEFKVTSHFILIFKHYAFLAPDDDDDYDGDDHNDDDCCYWAVLRRSRPEFGLALSLSFEASVHFSASVMCSGLFPTFPTFLLQGAEAWAWACGALARPGGAPGAADADADWGCQKPAQPPGARGERGPVLPLEPADGSLRPGRAQAGRGVIFSCRERHLGATAQISDNTGEVGDREKTWQWTCWERLKRYKTRHPLFFFLSCVKQGVAFFLKKFAHLVVGGRDCTFLSDRVVWNWFPLYFCFVTLQINRQTMSKKADHKCETSGLSNCRSVPEKQWLACVKFGVRRGNLLLVRCESRSTRV